MKKENYWYHLFFWSGIYLLWIILFRSYSITLGKTMTIEFCYLIFITADYYLIVYAIVPRLLQKGKYAYFVLAAVLLIAFSALLRTLVAIQMNLYFFHSAQQVELPLIFVRSLVNITVWVQLITIGKMLLDRMHYQRKLERIEKETVQKELDFLKAQINPHALFNSLNTIYGYIDKNNQIARNSLLQFSELLRYQLYDCAVEKISLEKELIYIRNYIAFQQLRKEEKLIVKLKIGVIESGLVITPLLLVVLIENAFKFVGSTAGKESIISIELYTENKRLVSYFSNTTEQQAAMNINSGGIGIANLKRRLELSYANKYEFTTKNEKGLYEVNLFIDLSGT